MIITPTEEQRGLQQRQLIDVPWINISNFLLFCVHLNTDGFQQAHDPPSLKASQEQYGAILQQNGSYFSAHRIDVLSGPASCNL